MEKYADIIESEERLNEGFLVQTLLKAMPPRIEVDSEWFFLPKKWLDKWEAWCYIDLLNAAPDAKV